MTFIDNFKGKQYKSEVERLQAEIARLNSLMTPQMRNASNMQFYIMNLQNQIGGLNNAIAQQQQQIANLNAQIADRNNAVEEIEAEVKKNYDKTVEFTRSRLPSSSVAEGE